MRRLSTLRRDERSHLRGHHGRPCRARPARASASLSKGSGSLQAGDAVPTTELPKLGGDEQRLDRRLPGPVGAGQRLGLVVRPVPRRGAGPGALLPRSTAATTSTILGIDTQDDRGRRPGASSTSSGSPTRSCATAPATTPGGARDRPASPRSFLVGPRRQGRAAPSPRRGQLTRRLTLDSIAAAYLTGEADAVQLRRGSPATLAGRGAARDAIARGHAAPEPKTDAARHRGRGDVHRLRSPARAGDRGALRQTRERDLDPQPDRRGADQGGDQGAARRPVRLRGAGDPRQRQASTSPRGSCRAPRSCSPPAGSSSA